MIIDAPFFYAGLVLNEHGIVIRAAPIIRYMVGHSAVWVRKYAAHRGWKVVE